MANRIACGIARIRSVDDGDPTAAYDLQRIVWADEHGRILVQSDADPKWRCGHGRQQASESIPLTEVLVDDQAADEPQAGCQINHPGTWHGPALAAGDHRGGHCGGAGRGAGY